MESEEKQQNARFRFSIDGVVFKSLMQYVGKFDVDTPTFIVSSEGIKLSAMDPTHVMALYLNIDYYAFEEFEVTKEGPLCIDITKLNKILRAYKKPKRKREYPDPIGLESDGQKLKVSFQGQIYELHILDLGSDIDVPEPAIDRWDCEAVINIKSLRKAVKMASEFSDVIKIEANADQLIISATNYEGEKFTKVYDRYDSEDLIDFSSDSEVKSYYTAELLSKVLSLTLCEYPKISLRHENPLMVEYPIDNIEVKAYLAPRVGEDYEPNNESETQEDIEDQNQQEVSEVSEIETQEHEEIPQEDQEVNEHEEIVESVEVSEKEETEETQEEIAESEVSNNEVSKTSVSEINIDFEGFTYVLIAFGAKWKANSLRDLPSNINGQVWKNENGRPIRII